MKKLVSFSVFGGILALLWGGLFAPSVMAGPGDVNGDGLAWTLNDMTYLIDYLFGGGPPPPNPVDADVDGFPGINTGDVLQFIDYFVYGLCFPLPYAGVGVKEESKIRFSADLIFSKESGIKDTVYIKIIENGGPDIEAMVIPLSYANQTHEVEVTLDSVSFEGSVIPEEWGPAFYIDDINKTVLLLMSGCGIPLSSGTTGIVATLYFTKLTDGKPLSMSVTEIPPAHSFMLFRSCCSETSPSFGRILSPMLSLKGDVNCDGVVDLGDVVYTINYLYKDGPPPCGL